jgi:hypothetical protein
VILLVPIWMLIRNGEMVRMREGEGMRKEKNAGGMDVVELERRGE